MRPKYPFFSPNISLIPLLYHTNLMSAYTLIFKLHCTPKTPAIMSQKTTIDFLLNTLFNTVLHAKTSLVLLL